MRLECLFAENSINFEDDELFCVGGEVQSGTRILASLCHIKCKKVKKIQISKMEF